jgi:hypothetical protein
MLRVLGSSYQARAYNIKYCYDVREFLEFFRLLLQRMVDEIWAGIRWVYEGLERVQPGRVGG